MSNFIIQLRALPGVTIAPRFVDDVGAGTTIISLVGLSPGGHDLTVLGVKVGGIPRKCKQYGPFTVAVEPRIPMEAAKVEVLVSSDAPAEALERPQSPANGLGNTQAATRPIAPPTAPVYGFTPDDRAVTRRSHS